MKHRRREISIFSTSTLDLFASGMGAFILLTIMALPFFPNTGNSAEQVNELLAELERASDERDAAQSRASSLEQVLAKLQRGIDVEAALQEALRESQRELSDARKSVEDLEQQLSDARVNARELEQALERAQVSGRDLKEAQERARALESALAEARKQLNDDAKRLQSLEEALANARLPHLDLVICLDVTRSMAEQIDGLKREIGVLAEILDKITPSAGVGIVAFGDRAWTRTIWTQPIIETSNRARLQSFVNSLEANMRDPQADWNRDYPEALARALETATRFSWRTESERQYIVVVSDNAAYPDREIAAIQAAQRFSGSAGRQVSAVRANFVDDRQARRAADRFLQQLASAGKGQFVDAAGGESIIGSLLLAMFGS